MFNTFNSNNKEEERRAERERQIAIMDTLISDFERTTAAPGAAPATGHDSVGSVGGSGGSGRSSDSRSVGSGSSFRAPPRTASSRGGGGGGAAPPAPTGAIENARRFLWDEDGEMEMDMPSMENPSDTGAISNLSLPSYGAGGSISNRSRPSYGAGGGSGSARVVPQKPSTSYEPMMTDNLFGTAGPGNLHEIKMPSSSSSEAPKTFGGLSPALGESFSNLAGGSMYDTQFGGHTRPSMKGRSMPSYSHRSGGDDWNRRSGVKMGQIKEMFGNIRSSITKSLVSESTMHNIDFESNIAPRRPSGGGDDFADMIDAKVTDAGPGWIETSTTTLMDGIHGCAYVAGDACSTGCSYVSQKKGVLLLVATAALIAVAAAQAVDFFTAGQQLTSLSPPPPSEQNDVPALAADGGSHNTPHAPGGGIIPEQKGRFDAVRQRILTSGVSTQGSLDEEGTPQYQALKWVADFDGATLDPEDDAIIQRYSLAVFFFSTFVSAEMIDREGYGSIHDNNVESGAKWTSYTNWMTSKGYCSWFGIKCHPKDSDPGETIYDGNGDISHFNLTKNNVRGSMPSEIAAFKNLVVLDLGENDVFSTIPEEIGSIGSLRTLYLGDNGISGTIPTTLGKLSQCTHLYLDNNALEGTIPTEFSELTNIHMLGLYENKLMGPVPDVSKMKDLRDLYLDSNGLSGKLPATLGEATSLKDIRLGSNQLTGSIPPEIGDLGRLSTLYLEDNMISGELPSEIGKLSSLVEVQLYDNDISGTLPSQIGDITGLKVLYLDNNAVRGTIPPSIRGCSSLNELYLHNNEIEGGIPPEVGELKYLEKMSLHGNFISGTVPLDVCSLTAQNLIELKGDCAGDEPTLTCECCTHCF